MIARALAAVLAALALAAAAPVASADSARDPLSMTSPLAVPAVGGDERPELLLAQRAITREWGLSEDSTYVELDLPQWKSEGGAFAASALLPGAGQLYAGEGSGWWFLLAEAGGWVGIHLKERDADRYRDRAAAFVGDPYDTASVFSFARLEREGADPSRLQALWSGDRNAFYSAIASDGTWQAGFRTAGEAGFAGYADLRDRSDRSRGQSRLLQAVLWANHLVSAWDALRAARFHNLPLRRDLELRVNGRWQRHGPALRAALERRF